MAEHFTYIRQIMNSHILLSVYNTRPFLSKIFLDIPVLRVYV